MKSVYHVSKNGSDLSNGSKESPFLTINHAAQVALPGDTVVVHEGVYREHVDPKNGGSSNDRRITYQAAENEKVVIKGSEVISNWQLDRDGVWYVDIENEFFGSFNPYIEKVSGDWLMDGIDVCHLGDVYLNGKSFYEVNQYDKLFNPTARETVIDHRTRKVTPVKDVEQTLYLWYTENDGHTTRIYANFHDYNPNEELVEINVRQNVFYPTETGKNYITVRGFEMAQAATPWAPPTADQPGLIGPHWSKGWIIENNRIHDAKCSAVSIGKEKRTGHNFRSIKKDKPGFIYQQEAVFEALRTGWDKETIGGHIIRNNVIYNCGQNGIVGHMGSAFCEIYDNHIYNIAIKREFYGHEIGGIKLHAAIDTKIKRNRIHGCALGIWLDWEAQGTKVCQNIFYDNCRDIYIEVTHGPHLVSHNIFGSDYSFENHAQGGAFINNIFAGKMEMQKILDRMTPFHIPHSTKVRGFVPVYSGDERFYQNIFIGTEEKEKCGTRHYNDYTRSLVEFIAKVDAKAPGDNNIFYTVEQPIYAKSNVYLNGAMGIDGEDNAYSDASFNPEFNIVEEGEHGYLEITLPEAVDSQSYHFYETDDIPPTRITEQDFEEVDESNLVLDEDLFGNKVSDPYVGPLSCLKSGRNRIQLW